MSDDSPAAGSAARCATPSCDRDVEPVADRRKCCLTCSDEPGMEGIHLAWCRQRNEVHESAAPSCPFCASPGRAVTATDRQALAHAAHMQFVHHEGSWRVHAETGECGCECRLCYVNDECVCVLCTYDHDHSMREAIK